MSKHVLTGILITRVSIPKIKTLTVSRKRLVQTMQQDKSVILVSASAGYGKTSLLQQYTETLQHPVAWLSIDESDNDIAHFWKYLVAAFQVQDKNFGTYLAALSPSNQQELYDALAQLMNHIATSRQFTLVLDDWHLIENPILEQSIAFLITLIPDNFKLIISSRIDPDLPLARMRVQGQLLEIRERDLRLLPQEMHQFFTQMRITLTEAQLEALRQKTEGWAAGLQLVALALEQEADIQGFIEQFTGTHRYIMDYLLDEVFSKQSPQIQGFLMQTAVLRRMNAALCNAVCDVEDSQTMIDQLEQGHLFIIALDQHKQWYRYHHLFGDLLRQRLRQSNFSMQELHLRASQWYADFAQTQDDNEALHEALMHAIKAKNEAWLIQLLNHVSDTLWQHSQIEVLQHALETISESKLVTEPQLLIYRAWYHLTHGRYDAANTVLATVEQQPIPDNLAGRVAACRAFIATFQQRLADTIREAETALAKLASGDSWMSSAAVALGDAHALRGFPVQAEAAYQKALQSASVSTNYYFRLNAGFKLAGMQRQQGRIKEAFATCNYFIEQAQENHLERTAVAGVLYGLRGDILAEWRKFDAAEADMIQATQNNQHRTHLGFWGWVNLYQIRLWIVQEQYEQAAQQIQRVTSESNLPPWLTLPYELTQVVLWLAQKDIRAAHQWLQQREMNLEAPLLPHLDGLYLIAARILMEQGQHEQVDSLLQRLITSMNATRRGGSTLIAYIIQAVNHYQQNNMPEAIDALTHALELGESGQFIQSFVSADTDIVPLLVEARNANIFPDYVTLLLNAFPDVPQTLLEPLSEREIEVLRLIASGMKNQQIADALVISLNTVLYHTKNIYGKLGVSRRTQAVQKAQQMGLL